MMDNTKEIPVLPFKHFLKFDEVTDFVSALAMARPDLVTLTSIGTSREGRALHLLIITDAAAGKPEDKPAYLIHGNIHALELSGTHAALYTARQLVIDHDKSDLLKRVAFYIVPRINPDGAEFAVTTSGSIRSRTDRSEREANTLYQEDVNGDGLILTMRQEHPDGSLVADPKDSRLLIRRKKDSAGPFYRTLPEGLIHDWDGTDNIRVEGRSFDWNRNWSYDWRPEPEQGGAGDFPFSEPEMRDMAEFINSHPNIFGVLGYHTGPGAVLRPPSTGSDADLDEGDVRVMEELAQIGAEHTGLPVYPVVKYHSTDRRDINLRGHFHNFGYHHLGLFVFEFELGILKNSAGIKTEEILAAKKPEEEEK
ncbi:MAG: M14 family metallopeptidase, partial [Candidatus Poribacteria bacterium]